MVTRGMEIDQSILDEEDEEDTSRARSPSAPSLAVLEALVSRRFLKTSHTPTPLQARRTPPSLSQDFPMLTTLRALLVGTGCNQSVWEG